MPTVLPPTYPSEDWYLSENTYLSDGMDDTLRPGPVPYTREGLHLGLRFVDFRFERLDQDEVKIGTLDSVRSSGGSIEWQSETAIKSSGSIDVLDIGQEVDWLNERIFVKGYLDVEGDDRDLTSEVPLGIYLPAAPVEKWDQSEGLIWSVELTDKLGILDQDILSDDKGIPHTYAAQKGRNVIDMVKTIIAETGETSPAIELGNATLTADMVWEIGTTRLQVINDVLGAAGMTSLYCDEYGQYRTDPYQAPADRPVVYTFPVDPFSYGEHSLVDPTFTRDRDIYAIPNKYVAVGNGSGGDGTVDDDGEDEAMVSVAINDNPNSPFSYQARGRWITTVVTGVEAVSQEDLDARAKQGLAQLSSVASAFSINHLWLPDVSINKTVRFQHEPSGTDMLCWVSQTTVSLEPGAHASSTLKEAMP